MIAPQSIKKILCAFITTTSLIVPLITSASVITQESPNPLTSPSTTKKSEKEFNTTKKISRKEARALKKATRRQQAQSSTSNKTSQELTIKTSLPRTEISSDPERFPIDSTIAIISWERTSIVSKSDLEKPALFGRENTLENIVNSELAYQDALHHKVPVDEEVIDRYLSSIQRQNKLAPHQIKEIFESAGYTLGEGRDLFRKMYAEHMMIDHKITSRLTVPENEIIAYHEAHPVVKEAKYNITIGFIPSKQNTPPAEQLKEIEQHIAAGINTNITWRSPFWLKENEIAPSKKFITSMQPQAISAPYSVPGGFEVIRLEAFKPEHTVPLHKRYKEIAQALQRPRMETMLNNYRNSLKNNASIVFFDTAHEKVI